jgi:hypothetical protein
MPGVMTNNIVPLVVMAVLMGHFVVFSYWFFRQIRNGRIDLRDNPRYSAPPSPRPLPDHDTTFGKRPEYDDDHVHYRSEE